MPNICRPRLGSSSRNCVPTPSQPTGPIRRLCDMAAPDSGSMGSISSPAAGVASRIIWHMSRCTQIADFGSVAGGSALKSRISRCVCTQIADSVKGPEATWNQFSGSCSRGFRRDTAGAGKEQFGSFAFKPRTNFLGNFVRDLTTNVRDFSAMTLQ